MRVLAGVVAVAVASPTASAAPRTVAVVGGDEVLRDAVTTALEPWEVEVIGVPDAAVTVEIAPSVIASSGADALVWIDPGEDSSTLWVYDGEEERVVGTRVIAVPPFDAPTAATVALSVKTLLRHSLVAPETERFGASAATVPGRAPRRRHRLYLDAGAGFRVLADVGTEVESRLGLRLTWYPTARLGLLVGLESGPGVSVDADDFVGQFDDTSATVAVRGRFDLGRLATYAQAGLRVHHTGIEGLIVSQNALADETRVNAGAIASLGLQARLGGDLVLEVAGEVDVALRRQRYTVFGEPIFAVPIAVGGIRFALAVPFF